MKKRDTIKKILNIGILSLLFILGSGFGEVVWGQIASWDFDGNNGDELTVSATSFDVNLLTPQISRGDGISSSSLQNSYNSNGFETSNTTLSGAVTTNEYLEFSIEPNQNFQVSLSTLDVNFRRSSTGPNTFQWQYSLDDFATSGINIDGEITVTGDGGDGESQTQIDLSGISDLQGVEDKITIRLYAWGASSTSGTFAVGRLSGDDLSIGGTVEVVQGTAALTSDPVSLTNFEYVEGNGPSNFQSIELSGENLDGTDVSVTAPTNFEVSETSTGTYGSSVTLSSFDGTATTIYARLESNLSEGTYDGDITASGGGAADLTIAVSGEVLAPLPSISYGNTYTENFSGFQDLNSLPNGWALDDSYTYRGAFSSSTTTSGVYGDGAVGFQLTTTGSTSTFSTTLTLTNSLASTLEAVSISYLGKVDRLDATRLPEWTVSVSGQPENDLTYRTELGEDQEKVIIVSGLNIQPDEEFTIVWSTESASGSGSNRKIGLTDVEIEAIEFYTEVTGGEGWRMMSVPVSSTSYSNLLKPLWTQGILSNANTTFGTANVVTYNGTDYSAVSDLMNTIQSGEGFLVYVYEDVDFDGVAESFPKTIGINGTEHSSDITPSLNSDPEELTILGNPFNSTISWAGLTKQNIQGTVYVYDHSYGVLDGGNSPPDVEAQNRAGNYRAWNGTSGSLTDGLIAPFQGFWVQNETSGTPSITIPTSAKTTGGTFYKNESGNVFAFSIRAQVDRMFNDTYFSFTKDGKIKDDKFDALKFSPLDFGDYVSIGSIERNNLLDINNMPIDFEGEIEIPLSIQAFESNDESGTWLSKNGEVTLTWNDIDNMPENWSVNLIDHQQDLIIDLKKEEAFTFYLEADQYEKKHKIFSKNEPIQPIREMISNKSRNNRISLVISKSNSITDNQSSLPSNFTLNQNYPNPFNPTTVISYDLPENSQVNLAVYDMMGRRVATLVNENVAAGTHQVQFDASSLSSGTYMYRLQAGGNIQTKKLTLIK
jgi:hypothetical protein